MLIDIGIELLQLKSCDGTLIHLIDEDHYLNT